MTAGDQTQPTSPSTDGALGPATRAEADELLQELAGPGTSLRDDQWTAIDALGNRRASSTPSVVATLEDGARRDLKTSSRPLAPLEWEHVAVTYDGHRLALYLNGRLASQSDGVVFAKTGPETLRLVLGRHSSGAFHRQFRGQLDEVRLDARAWSAGEVLTRYRIGLKAIAAFSAAGDAATK